MGAKPASQRSWFSNDRRNPTVLSRKALPLLVTALLLLGYASLRKGEARQECEQPPPRVCSHMGRDSDLGQTGVSLQSVASLVAQGIECFDLDVFWTREADADSLYVGHAASLQASASLPEELFEIPSRQLHQRVGPLSSSDTGLTCGIVDSSESSAVRRT